MNRVKEPFEIDIKVSEAETRSITIYHETETFDFDLEGQEVSLINNGDNSWSIVSGTVSQEEINLIGTEIEKHYQSLEP